MTAKEILEKDIYNWKDIAAFTLEDYLPTMLEVLVNESAISELSEDEKEEIADYVLTEFSKV